MMIDIVVAFKEAFARFPSGVVIATTIDAQGQARGFTASSFSSVSLDPPLVLVCLSERSNTCPHVVEAGAFAVNILRSGDESAKLGRYFAGKAENKFDGLGYTAEATGAPILDTALAWFDCRLHETHAGGDHSIFVCHVIAAAARDAGTPLTFFRGDFSPPLSR